MALSFAKLANRAQAVGLELPNALRTNAELLPNLAERVSLSVQHARAQTENVSGLFVEVGELLFAEAVEGDRR